MMDYKAIACLRQVVDSQSFEKAGEVLGLTQSAVSQKVKKLEVEYGAPLLLRERPLCLTDIGKNLVAHLIKVELMEQRILSETKQESSIRRVPIAVNHDSLATWFMSVLKIFSTNKDTRIQLKTADEGQTRNLLQKGEVVACISDVGTPVAGGDAVFLGYLEYVLVASPTYIKEYLHSSITPQTVANAPGLLFDGYDQLWRRCQAEILETELSIQQCHWLPSSYGFVEMLLAGTVCAPAPRMQVQQELECGDLVELFPNKSISIPLYWHWYKLDSLPLDRLTFLVKEKAKQSLNI